MAPCPRRGLHVCVEGPSSGCGRLGFERSAAHDDLVLGLDRQGVPLLRRRAGRGDVGVHDRVGATGEPPREVEAVRLHAVADERRHGHATVLDLGVPEPTDGLLEVASILGLVEDAERVCGARTTRRSCTCELRHAHKLGE